MNFAYNCKFCGKPGVVSGDERGTILINPAVWIPRICCDRCGDFMVAKRKLETSTVKVCRVLQTCGNKKQDERKEIEDMVMARLVDITKAIAALVCSHYRLTNVWERDFAMQIFEKPDMALRTISAYIRSVAAESKRAHQPASRPQHNDA